MPAQLESVSMGDRLSQLRRDRGMTQAQLARQTGLSASTIAMYETNRRTPDKAAVKKLATALRVRMAVVQGHETLPQPSAVSSAGKAPRAAAKSQPVTKRTATKRGAAASTAPAMSASTPTADESNGLTQLALTIDEARIILFLRMNPNAMPFVQSYITATGKRREQVERTWRIIHEFQAADNADN